jgi:hypothetical protein
LALQGLLVATLLQDMMMKHGAVVTAMKAFILLAHHAHRAQQCWEQQKWLQHAWTKAG